MTEKRYVGQRWGLITLLLMLAVGANASSIIPNDGESITVNVTSAGDADLVTLAPPNENGISVNSFYDFTVNTRPIKIANLPRYENTTNDQIFVGPAELIVIRADTLSIRNAVTLMGPAADIVFINEYGNVSCVNCSFDNFLRVSLAAAWSQQSLSSDISELGVINSRVTSEVLLNGVYAPGAISFDVIAGVVTQEGVIDINDRAIQDTRGGFTNVAHGNLKVGTGQVSLMSGDVGWDYESHQLVRSGGDFHRLSEFQGLIAAPSVKITASNQLEIRADIDTRTDLISTVTYKNGTHIPSEGIDISGFGSDPVVIFSDLISNGSINIASNQVLEINRDVRIDGEVVSLISKDELMNKGSVHGASVSLAGLKVENEGNLIAADDIEIWGEGYVANQYGGYISGDQVTLVSRTEVVRNGSRTPFRSHLTDAVGILDALSNSYVTNLEPTKLGTFYSLRRVPNSVDPTSVWMANTNTAHIGARVLSVDAVAFENINPYYKPVENNDYLEISRDKLEQVRISVEDNISIKASSYMLNSSAKIIQNSPTGLVHIDAPLFTNERYRIETILNYQNDTSTTTETTSTEFIPGSWIDKEVTTTTVDEIAGTQTIAYSPPAMLVVMGDLLEKSSQSLINNTAYIEVFGDATVDSPYIYDYGLQNQAITKFTSSTTEIESGYVDVGMASGNIYNENSYSDSSRQAVDPNQLDSLFYVHGDFIANADYLQHDGNAMFANHNPLDYFIQEALDNIITSQRYEDIRTRDTTEYQAINFESLSHMTTRTHGGQVHVNDTNIDNIKAGGEISVTWSLQEDTHYYVADRWGNTSLYMTDKETIRKTDRYSLINELRKLFERLLASFESFYNEFAWWE